MVLTEYSETIGPVRFGVGGVPYIDYDLSKRANITIVSVNCIWTGTAVTSQYFPASGCWPAQAAYYDPDYQYHNSGSGILAGVGTCYATTSCPSMKSFQSGSYRVMRNGSQIASGSCGCGSQLSYPGAVNTTTQIFWDTYYLIQGAYHAAIQAGCANPAHTDYYYTTPTTVSVGSVVAATFSQGGYLNAGANSNSYAITASKILPGSVNRINSGAIGGNESSIP